jgi:hypothetical protein
LACIPSATGTTFSGSATGKGSALPTVSSTTRCRFYVYYLLSVVLLGGGSTYTTYCQ